MLFTVSRNAIEKARRISRQRAESKQRYSKGYVVLAYAEGGTIKVPALSWKQAIETLEGFPASYTVEVRKAGIVQACRRASAIIDSLTK